MAEVDRLLHEERREDLLGGAVLAALLGGQLIRRGARDGGDRCGISVAGTTGRARRSRSQVLSQRRDQLPHQAARRDPGGCASARPRWLGCGLPQAAAPRLVRFPRAWRRRLGTVEGEERRRCAYRAWWRGELSAG